MGLSQERFYSGVLGDEGSVSFSLMKCSQDECDTLGRFRPVINLGLAVCVLEDQ